MYEWDWLTFKEMYECPQSYVDEVGILRLEEFVNVQNNPKTIWFLQINWDPWNV